MGADYLVVGAGLSGLAFTDALVAADPAAEVLLVDRRAEVGGHWLHAYPFVRLHSPSAYYGVASRTIGDDMTPLADGSYPRASAHEVLAHLQGAKADLEATGRVRFLGAHDHLGEGRLASLLGGRTTEVEVRRAIVDTTYFDTAVPATHERGFAVDDGARVVPVGALAEPHEPAERYVVLGSGKTAMDAVAFLLRNGAGADRITWVRPRDQWVMHRRDFEPGTGAHRIAESLATDLEAVAAADSPKDLMHRLEAAGRLHRLDPAVEPAMFRCVLVDDEELALLRSVRDVVRLGRVRRAGARELVLEHGTIPTGQGVLHVDATACGIGVRPAQPVFTPGRITIGQLRPCSPALNAALIAYVEATRRGDLDEQNRLCPPVASPSVPASFLHNLVATLVTQRLWREEDVRAWLEASRLHLARGLRRDDPRVQAATERSRAVRAAVTERLPRLLAQA